MLVAAVASFRLVEGIAARVCGGAATSRWNKGRDGPAAEVECRWCELDVAKARCSGSLVAVALDSELADPVARASLVMAMCPKSVAAE